MGKMLRISNNFSSEAVALMLLKFHVGPPCWGGGGGGRKIERLLKWTRSIEQDGCHAHIW